MTFHDPIGSTIEARLVERMRHLADKPSDGVARGSIVSASSVMHEKRTFCGRAVAVSRQKSGVGNAPQQPIPVRATYRACVPIRSIGAKLSFHTRRRCSTGNGHLPAPSGAGD